MTFLFIFLILSLLVVFGCWLLLRVLTNPAWGAFLLLFFLPFERIPSLDIFGATLRVNHLVGLVAGVIWCTQVLARRRPVQSNPLLPSLLFFFGTLLLAFLGAQDQSRAITVLLFTIGVIALSLLVPQLLTARRDLKPALLVLGCTTIITLIFSLYQFLGDLAGLPLELTGLTPAYTKAVFGFPRIQAFSQEPLYYGNFLLVPIALALALLMVQQNWFPRRALILFLIGTLTALALTLSRGAIVGFAATLSVLLVYFGRQFLTVANLRTFFLGLAVAGSLAVVTVSAIGPDARAQFVDHLTVGDFARGEGESTFGRLGTWVDAIELWQTAPMLGIGPGNFGPSDLDYPAEKPEVGWGIVNNEYLELLAETGLIGLASFFLFLVFFFVRSWHAISHTTNDPPLRAVLIGLTAAVFGMLVQYIFFSTLYITSIWLTFGLLMACQTIALTHHSEPQS